MPETKFNTHTNSEFCGDGTAKDIEMNGNKHSKNLTCS